MMGCVRKLRKQRLWRKHHLLGSAARGL